MPTTIIEQFENGTNEIGPRRRHAEGTWFRDDIYTSKEWGITHEARFCAGPDDVSPMARPTHSARGNCRMDSRCSCCYYGFSHTLERHNRDIQ